MRLWSWGAGERECVPALMYPGVTCLLPFLPRSKVGGGSQASPWGQSWGAVCTSTRAITCVSLVRSGTELGGEVRVLISEV